MKMENLGVRKFLFCFISLAAGILFRPVSKNNTIQGVQESFVVKLTQLFSGPFWYTLLIKKSSKTVPFCSEAMTSGSLKI